MSQPIRANDLMIPYEIIRSKYDNNGIIGIGRDWVLELQSTNYLLVESKSSYKILMQHYQSLPPEIYKVKVERIVEASGASYCSHLQKVIAFSMQERKNGDKDLYILYDYNEVATNFENYLAEQRAGDGIQEEEVYEFIYTCLDTCYLSCMNHMEYLTMNPYNIFISKSQYQKFILGNSSLTIPGKEKILDFGLPTDNFTSIKPLSRDSSCTERAVLFKVGMLALYMIGTQDMVTFHNEFKSKLTTQLIQFRLQQQVAKMYSPQLVQLLNDMLFLNEAIRPTLKQIMEVKSDKYFPRPLKYYAGTIMNNAYEFKGWVEWYNDASSGELKKQMTGLCTIGGLFNGHFVQTRKFGYGLSIPPSGIYTWGNWEDDKVSQGLIFNTVQRYIFIGEFKDDLLSNASGSLVYLRDCQNQAGIIACEGEFIDGKIVSGECWTLDGKYTGGFEDGMFSGDGVFVFRYPKSGIRIWQGPFVQGKFHGVGLLKKTDGTEVQARFTMGQRVDG